MQKVIGICIIAILLGMLCGWTVFVQGVRQEHREEVSGRLRDAIDRARQNNREVAVLRQEVARLKGELEGCDKLEQANADCHSSLGYLIEESVKRALEVKDGRKR